LLDRFGLYTRITTINDLDERVEIVERRERFERDPESFIAEFNEAQEKLRQRLIRAKKMHASVTIDRSIMRSIAELCVALNVDGHRGELTIARATRALAALESRAFVTLDDVKRMAVMSLRHRLRKDPLEKIDSGQRIQQAIEAVFAKVEKVTAIR